MEKISIMNIKSPDFLKQLNIDDLNNLASDIRQFIIENVSKTGGHLSSNLGIIEATIALHYVFNSPIDKILFDVGHQCYTHKILTGRAQDFCKLRQKDGISGFLKYSESDHDIWETGHSSTTLSAVAGFLEAKELNKTPGEVIAVIGDGSIQNGVSFEGLNYIGSQKRQKAIIIINDNEMSISKNVGRLATRMSKIRIKKGYNRLKGITPKILKKSLMNFKIAIRSFVYRDNLFTSLGYKYYGPIDGHNIKELIQYFEFAKSAKESVIIHINTIKGKGYEFAENDKLGTWHGISPFSITTGKPLENDENLVSWSKGISKIYDEMLEIHQNITIISPAMLTSACLTELKSKYNNRIIDVGINEEHALIMAAVMSRNEIVPIISIYSTFFQRGYDFLNHDICRSNNHVIFLIDRSGIVSGDGNTHQGIFDIAMMSHLPNMVIAMPKDLNEAYNLMEFAYHYNGPIAIRYPKTKTTIFNQYVSEPIILGSWKEEIASTIDSYIITYGNYVNEFLKNFDNINWGLINARFIKPIDIELIKKLSPKKIIVVEEVVEYGSLYTLLLHQINQLHLNIEIEGINIGDQYIDLGTREQIKEQLLLDVQTIINRLRKEQ